MNFRLFIFFAPFLLLSCASFAQSVDADLKGKNYAIINEYTEYLQVDTLIGLDSVRQASITKKFIRFKNNDLVFLGYDPYFYWYRFSISNKDSTEKKIVLLLGGLSIRKAEGWQGKLRQWKYLGATGYEYAFKDRPYRYVHFAFPITIPANTNDTIYLKVDESHAYKSIGFVLAKPAFMQQTEHSFYFKMGIIIGLLLLFFLLNLYLYISIKDKIHLWYSLYIFTITFYLLQNEGLESEFFGLDSALAHRLTYSSGVASLVVAFLLQVVQMFLANIRGTAVVKIMELLKWSCFIIAIIQFFVFYVEPANEIEFFIFQVANKIGLASFAFLIIACLYSFFKGFKLALFILLGQFLFIVGAVSRALFLGRESFLFPPSLFEIGLVAEVIVISFGMMYRYNLYRKEKELLAAQLNKERLNTVNEILTAQVGEQKRIAADLHDELGGNLAAIKLTLQSFDIPRQQAETLNYLVDTASANTRHIAHNLMPPEFESTSLQVMLENFYQRINTEGKIKFRFYCSGTADQFDKQVDLIVYRILMELTNNIIKHSRASEATIQLVYHKAQLTIMAEDNGVGMKTSSSKGIGLKNVALRVSYLSGIVNIDSNEKGTTVMIQIPYK